MKDEPSTSAPEAKPTLASQASNLLDMAKERAERRAERQKVRLIRQATNKTPAKKIDDDEEDLGARVKSPKNADAVAALLRLPDLPKVKRKLPWTKISFLAVAIVPTILTALYYAFIASPQYVVESQFAVRGSAQNNALGALGLASLVSPAAQSGDSYVVTDYIHSAQVLNDIKAQTDVDIRALYSQPSIDFLYRRGASEPLDEFQDYWRKMVNVSFNSTTGNVTLRVFAFTPEDSKTITDAILTVSEQLVNSLSERSRQQFIDVANQQVAKSEERLRNIRAQMADLRRTEQAVDPAAVATMESTIIAGLEGQLATLKTRYKALRENVSSEAPSARVIERQIAALESQLNEQRNRLSGSDSDITEKTSRSGEKSSRTLPELINRFSELTVEEEFATKAYTTSLTALEMAIQDARKQDLYFGVYVAPRIPEIALYPQSLINTLIVFLAAACAWLIGYFTYRSVKDHAI